MSKTAKRLMTALLAASLLLSGCSSKNEPTEAVTTLAPATEAVTTETPSTEAPTTEAATTAAPTTEEPTTAAPTTEEPTTEAPTTEAPTTAPPETEVPTTAAPSERAASTDYDPSTNRSHNMAGIVYQVPGRWHKNNDTYYASADVEAIAFMNVLSREGITASLMRDPDFAASYSQGMSSAFQENAEVVRSELTEVNGREMILSELTGTTRGHRMDLRAASMISPDGGSLVAFVFAQFEECPVDYSADFEKIIEDLQDADESGPGTEELTEVIDFEPETNIRYTVHGIEFQIPSNWLQKDPYFYASTEAGSISMVSYYSSEGVTENMMTDISFIDAYNQGMLRDLQGDPKILRSEMMEVDGRKILRTRVQGTTNGMEMIMDFASMSFVDGEGLLMLSLAQSVNAKVDYSGDFEMILQYLRNVE